MSASTTHDPDIAAIAAISGVQTILETLTAMTGLRLALVARVTQDGWKALAVHDALGFGLKVGDHLGVSTTFCSEVRASGQPILIEHVAKDPTYHDHHTPRIYNLQSYLAVPIFLANGEYFGNVCGLDSDPRVLREKRAQEMMEAFAKLIGMQLDAQHTAELREQFIAVIGHDLRNPLNAMMSGTQLLQQLDVGERAEKVLARMERSGQRMANLLDDVVDFARGRLGGGIEVDARELTDLGAVITEVVSELQSAHAGREIRLSIGDLGAVRGDRVRLGQLGSNLLANAVQHGAADAPIHVALEQKDGEVVLSVSNRGEPISPEALEQIFQPFVRGKVNESGTGLGLGLYIASEIVRSHGGKLTVSSTKDAGTTFRCSLPAHP